MTSVTPPSIVSEYYFARMYSKSFLMLEGTADEDTWEKFIDHNRCYPFPMPKGEGKDSILAALEIELSEVLGAAGLVDGDYWLITESVKLQTKNLLYDSIYPDAELVVLKSPALFAVFNSEIEYIEKSVLLEFSYEVQNQALRLAMEFGYFRLLNEIEGFGINFREFWKSHNYNEFIDTVSMSIRDNWFARRLAADHQSRRSTERDPRTTHEVLLTGVNSLKATDKYQAPNIQLCQGHETVALIAYLLPIMFKSAFGHELPSSMNRLLHRSVLEKVLRDEYKEKYFVRTKLRECIVRWQDANPDFRIIRDFTAQTA